MAVYDWRAFFFSLQRAINTSSNLGIFLLLFFPERFFSFAAQKRCEEIHDLMNGFNACCDGQGGTFLSNLFFVP